MDSGKPISDNNHDNRGSMSRRKFLGLASMAAGAVATGCSGGVSGVNVIHDEIPGIRTIKGNMSYRVNPRTGHNISVLAFGTAHFPTLRSNTYTSDNMNQEAVNRLIDYAIDHGVNYFNTSPIYSGGYSEEVLGKALAKHPREAYYLATKISNFSPNKHTVQEGKDMFENSLKRLGVEYVDNILLHAIGVDGLEGFKSRFIDSGILDYLRRERDRGRLRNIGFSFSGNIEALDYALQMHDRGEIQWDFGQISLNMLDWYHPSDANDNGTDSRFLYNELVKRDLPVLAVDPLRGGQLGSVPTPIMKKMLRMRPGDSVSSWALRFIGSLPGVLSMVTGMSYMEHLKDHLYTCSPLEPLTPEEEKFVEEIAADLNAHDLVPCIGCDRCLPCPYGVNIPDIFSHCNRCLHEDMIEDDTRDPEYAKKRRVFLRGMDNSVPKLQQADHCTECGLCINKCPQRINIPKALAKIAKYTEKMRRNA